MRWIALIGACLVLAGCGSTIFGNARPGADLRAAGASTTTSAAPTPTSTAGVPPADVKKLLLGVPDIESIIGETGVTSTMALDAPNSSSEGIDPGACRSIALPGKEFTFTSFRQGYAGDILRSPARISIGQVIITFDTADRAVDQLALVNRTWEDCPEDQPYTQIRDNEVLKWTRGPITATDDRLAVTATLQADPVRTCHHIFAAKSNAIVESIVCNNAGDPVGQAGQIADRILAKIPA